ncbi:MAG: hypothetical protein JW816_00085 [Candidatus Buchananbacteria bacterium]|nr:hypothetical protein [Candidatus Buchananbacteria bacterium]
MIKRIITYSIILLFLASLLAIPLNSVSAIESLRIQNISVVTTDTSATISWQTNKKADGRIDYGPNTGSYPYRLDTNKKTDNQSITIYGLTPETRYFFKVTSRDEFTEVYSYEQNFKTIKAVDTTVPVISHVVAIYVTGTTATIQWVTNEPSTTEVEYGKTERYGSRAVDGRLVTVHDITIKGLGEATAYQFRVASKDKDNNAARWYNMSFRTNDTNLTDKGALTIYDVKPSSENDPDLTQTSAVVSWRTNKLASGKVYYGTSQNNLNKSISLLPPRDFVGSLGLTNLAADTVYYYRIEATDVFGRTVKSEGHSFRTKSGYNTVDVTTDSGQVLGASTQGLIVYLPFDEGKGSLAEDMSYNGNDGYLDPTNPPAWATGKFATALNFSGNKQNVSVPDNDEISLRDQVSMMAWVNLNGFGSYNKIITKEDSYEILLGPNDGVLRMAIYSQGASDWQWLNTPTKPLVKGQWQLVAATYDGKVMKLYVNGRVVAQRQYAALINDTSYPMYIGGNVVDNKEWFNGLIDDAAVFNYALSEAEIQNVYQSGVADYLDSVGIPTQNSSPVGGQVLGVTYVEPQSKYVCNPNLGYVKFTALYKTADSPDVWAITENNQRHYITSPDSFNQYECSWSRVKLVSNETLNSYPIASLVKGLDNSVVYHLFQRPQQKWLKLAIPSPTVFISYENNFWGNIIRINDYDLNSYPDAKLIKTADNSNIYLLEGNTKRLIPNQAVFDAYGFSQPEVVTINQIHMDSYTTGQPLQ